MTKWVTPDQRRTNTRKQSPRVLSITKVAHSGAIVEFVAKFIYPFGAPVVEEQSLQPQLVQLLKFFRLRYSIVISVLPQTQLRVDRRTAVDFSVSVVVKDGHVSDIE